MCVSVCVCVCGGEGRVGGSKFESQLAHFRGI